MAATEDPTLQCGLVGPGRRRQGLGPFLARELEAAGCAVVAVAGRDLERTGAAAAQLAADHGHRVAAHDAVTALLAARPLDALVVAAPIAAHLPALRAAAAAGVAVLCEKPLVAPEEADLVPGVVEAFAAAGRLLMENCQWPYVLPALHALHPDLRGAPVERLRMRLSPTGRGRSMLVDAVSHLLSLAQALVPIDASTRLAAVAVDGDGPDAERLELRVELESPFPRLPMTLYLARCEAQPRPAWIEVNGRRGDRRIEMSDYTMSLCCEGRAVPLADPLSALVRDFVQSLREPDRDRVRAEGRAIRERFRLYAGIVGTPGGRREGPPAR